jgi:hypothetical protein
VGRLLLTLATQILGIRRRGEYDENLFCLNHYVTQSNLERCDHDMYSALLYSDYIAVGQESRQQLQEFWDDNAWRLDYYPYALPRQHSMVSRTPQWKGKKYLEALLEYIGIATMLNFITKRLQQKKIQNNPLTQVEGARIKAEDSELEFHPYPNSAKMIQRFNQYKNYEL